MILKSVHWLDTKAPFSVILFPTSKFDFHNFLTEMPSDFNPNSGTELVNLARNKENDCNKNFKTCCLFFFKIYKLILSPKINLLHPQ